MAPGFGFNKQKIMAAAEKGVQQGKLQVAITEYEKIVKADPKDVTVLNTIGDLNARLGNNDKAAVYFKRVGDLYATEGFTVKAIAVYKKIAKLNPGATDCILKLAELYTQQGLNNDARQQYVALADQHMKANNLEDAAAVFKKILALDPENTAMQSKLADLFMKLGKKDEARNIFMTAAQALHQRGALKTADEALRRVVELDPGNLEALLLRGKIAADSGDSASAIQYLEKIPDLDSRPDALKALLVAQVNSGNFSEAEPLAKKLFTVHQDASGLTVYAEGLLHAGSLEPALKIYDEYSDRLLAANAPVLVDKLISSINKISENAKALELLRGIFIKAGERSRINEVSELLAHASVQSGDLKKAEAIYKELSELEPENPLHLQNYRQIQAKLGKDPTVRQLSKEEGAQAFMVDELEHQAPELEQKYSNQVREAVRGAITEAELFESYSMPGKAVAPLEAVLAQAPRDAQVNQKLAVLYARSGRLQQAIQCCEVLEAVYSEAGHASHAGQYAEMAAKFKERMLQAASTAAIEFDASFMPGGEVHGEGSLAASAQSSQEIAPGPAPSSPAEMPALQTESATVAASESEFQIEAAPQASASTELLPAPQAGVTDFSVNASVTADATTPQLEVIANAETTASHSGSTGAHEIDLSDWEAMTQIEEPPQAEVTPAIMQADAPQTTVAAEQPIVAEISFEVSAPEAEVSAAPIFTLPIIQEPLTAISPPAPAPVAPAAVSVQPAPKPIAKPQKKDALADFVLDLDESLGEDFAVEAQPAKAAAAASSASAAMSVGTATSMPVVAAKAALHPSQPRPTLSAAEASTTLSDMFAEFKEGVEEASDDAEDPDTHYNLGVAFKEMGLLDEAIGELQKVCHSIEKGHPFSQVIQAYTWLAHCFLEKGAPEASVKWYEKALHVASTDEESKLAIYYELGSAYEAAGNKRAALQNFNEVYSNNIDYRDVAERIKTLKS